MRFLIFIIQCFKRKTIKNGLTQEQIFKFRKTKYYHPEIENWKFTDLILSCVPGGGWANWAFIGVTKEGKVLLKNTCGSRSFCINERDWNKVDGWCWNETMKRKQQILKLV